MPGTSAARREARRAGRVPHNQVAVRGTQLRRAHGGIRLPAAPRVVQVAWGQPPVAQPWGSRARGAAQQRRSDGRAPRRTAHCCGLLLAAHASARFPLQITGLAQCGAQTPRASRAGVKGEGALHAGHTRRAAPSHTRTRARARARAERTSLARPVLTAQGGIYPPDPKK